MKTNLSNYQSDYENLKKMEQYVNSIITIVKGDDINTIKKNMRKEGIRETDITYFVNLVQTMKITSTKDEIIESLLTNEENKYFLPQYIQRVPTINFAKTIEFLGKKAQSQNMAILESEKEKEKRKDEPIEEDGFNIRKKSSVRRRRSSVTRKKSSVRRRRSSGRQRRSVVTRKKSSGRQRRSSVTRKKSSGRQRRSSVTRKKSLKS